jgi:hypothetical protein
MEKRRVEVKRIDVWTAVGGLTDVKMGDVFRMFEPDGTPVLIMTAFEAQACCDGFLEDGKGQINAEPLL